MLLLNDPVPVPLLVCNPVATGFTAVDQHTPLAVIGEPPSEVILPPEMAVVPVIEVTAVVVRVAAPGVKLMSLPYAVPSLFIPTNL